jgi:hypothetical protein
MRVVVISLTVAAVIPLASAAANSLHGLTTTKVGSNAAAIPLCDADGFTPSYTTSGGNITSVTVSGIADPGCEGGSLKLSVVDSAGVSLASGGPQTIPTDAGTVDNTVTVTVSPQPSAASAAGVHVSVVGP